MADEFGSGDKPVGLLRLPAIRAREYKRPKSSGLLSDNYARGLFGCPMSVASALLDVLSVCLFFAAVVLTVRRAPVGVYVWRSPLAPSRWNGA